MAGAGVIDEYVGDLARRLRGPAHVKADLLAEARDSLDDAADSYRDTGLSTEDAERRAVGEFGPLAVVAPGYQAELAAAHAATMLRTVMLLIPLTYVLWELNRMFWIGPWTAFDQGPTPSWYVFVSQGNGYVPWIITGIAGASLAAGRLLSRRGVSGSTLSRLGGLVAAGCVGLGIAFNLSVVIGTAALDAPRLLMPAPVLLAGVWFYVVFIRVGVLARRCLVLSAV
ncbi:permease prefix domain 1-containing protein [Umezawaea endophytica]|uniref:Permease prefix domain 1-containing protein n=1 Tax=Umezawaea endophytica TaxID=1654476 RepID=A0A9X2VP75_9PSEU|nr:permease prefix domain 1-containing protein [Umezawaea endophytica]MCS7479769.1 permease prefix domain 1-containing protein [Umezawaea endophytica]